jgi:hypothetical protein
MQMKRNYHGHSYFSPFMLWGDLATKTLEMKQISTRPPAVKEWFESKVVPAWRKAGLPE